MFETIRNVLYASLGLVALTTDKLKEAVEDLVRRGELSAEQGRRLVEELLARGRDDSRTLAQRIAEDVVKVLSKTPVASRREVQRLEARLRKVEERLGMTSPDEVPPASEAAAAGPENAAFGPDAPGAV